MAIDRIDTELCNGCALCSDICPADVIRMDDKAKKAVIRYLEDCSVCGLCELECPQHAIHVSPVRIGM